MKCWWIMPMPRSMASDGEFDADRLSLEPDLALVGVVEPVQDIHQSALPRPVLAQEGVNLAAPDVEVHPVVGHHAREALGDPLHSEERCGAVQRFPRP